jgi:hypothetical protein
MLTYFNVIKMGLSVCGTWSWTLRKECRLDEVCKLSAGPEGNEVT